MPSLVRCVLPVGLTVLLLLFSLHSPAKTLIFQSQPEPSPERESAPTELEPAQQSTTYSTSRNDSSVSASAASELLFMIEQLQQEVRVLRGLVEEQAYQLRSLQESSKARYRDLDSRVMELTKSREAVSVPRVGTSASATAVVVPAADTPAGSNRKAPAETNGTVPTEEQKLAYQEAYQLIKERKFEQAVDALHAFIDKYPDGELSGNAYYWLGEVYLVIPKLEQAKQAFSIVVKSFPGHRKLPDALFKLAVTHDRMQDPAGSEKLLNEVQQKFPQSTAAKLAESYKISR